MALHKCRAVLEALQLVSAEEQNQNKSKGHFKEGLPEAISLNLERVVFVEGDFVIRQGEEPEGMFFVSDGTASVIKDGTVITTLGRGSFFGEMALLQPEGRASATIQVSTFMDGYCLSRKAFEKLKTIYPTFREYLESVAKLRMQAATMRKKKAAMKSSGNLLRTIGSSPGSTLRGAGEQFKSLLNKSQATARFSKWLGNRSTAEESRPANGEQSPPPAIKREESRKISTRRSRRPRPSPKRVQV